MKLILESGMSNTLVVVTRYFGGILLGTGGLLRAYTDVTKKALENAEIIKKTRGYEAIIKIDYNSLEALKYYVTKEKIKILNVEYLEKIEVTIELQKQELNKFMNGYNNNNKFSILEFNTIKEKFIEI